MRKARLCEAASTWVAMARQRAYKIEVHSILPWPRYLGGNPLPFRLGLALPVQVEIPPPGLVFSALSDKAREGILLLAESLALFGDALGGPPQLVDGGLDVVLGDALHLREVMQVGQDVDLAVPVEHRVSDDDNSLALIPPSRTRCFRYSHCQLIRGQQIVRCEMQSRPLGQCGAVVVVPEMLLHLVPADLDAVRAGGLEQEGLGMHPGLEVHPEPVVERGGVSRTVVQELRGEGGGSWTLAVLPTFEPPCADDSRDAAGRTRGWKLFLVSVILLSWAMERLTGCDAARTRRGKAEAGVELVKERCSPWRLCGDREQCCETANSHSGYSGDSRKIRWQKHWDSGRGSPIAVVFVPNLKNLGLHQLLGLNQSQLQPQSSWSPCKATATPL